MSRPRLSTTRSTSDYPPSVVPRVVAQDSDLPGLGQPCASGDRQCAGENAIDTRCYHFICGAPNAVCFADDYTDTGPAPSTCLSGKFAPLLKGDGRSSYCCLFAGYCSNNRCGPVTDPSAIPIGGECDYTTPCANYSRCWFGICGGENAYCENGDPGAWCASGKYFTTQCIPKDVHLILNSLYFRFTTVQGICSNNHCVQGLPDGRFKGDPCDQDHSCIEEGVFCSPDGICGGERAPCVRDGTAPSVIGESDDCFSGMWLVASTLTLVHVLRLRRAVQRRQSVLFHPPIRPWRLMRFVVRLLRYLRAMRQRYLWRRRSVLSDSGRILSFRKILRLCFS